MSHVTPHNETLSWKKCHKWHLILWHCHQKKSPQMTLSPFQETWSSCSPPTLLWYLSANSFHENDSHILWIGTFQIHIHTTFTRSFHGVRLIHEMSIYIYDVITIFWDSLCKQWLPTYILAQISKTLLLLTDLHKYFEFRLNHFGSRCKYLFLYLKSLFQWSGWYFHIQP